MPKSKKKATYEVFVTYYESETGGIPESDEPYSSRSDLHRDVTWKNAYREHPGGFPVENVIIDFDPFEAECIHLVVVTYESGDTFGRSYGNFSIAGAYKKTKEAMSVKNRIEYDYRHPGYKAQYTGYKPWDGYFEELTCVEIITLALYD